eukprot:g60497.t1
MKRKTPPPSNRTKRTPPTNEEEEPTGNTSNPPADNSDRKVNPKDDYCIHASSHRPHTRKSHRSATKRPKPHVQRNTSSTSKPTNWRKKITNQQQTETQKIEQAQQDIEQNKKRLDSQESDVRKLSGGVDSLRQETKQMLQQLQDIKAQQQPNEKTASARRPQARLAAQECFLDQRLALRAVFDCTTLPSTSSSLSSITRNNGTAEQFPLSTAMIMMFLSRLAATSTHDTPSPAPPQ